MPARIPKAECCIWPNHSSYHGMPCMLRCVLSYSAAPSPLLQVLSSPGYLQLSMADAKLGQQFMQAAMQRAADGIAVARGGLPSPFTPMMV